MNIAISCRIHCLICLKKDDMTAFDLVRIKLDSALYVDCRSVFISFISEAEHIGNIGTDRISDTTLFSPIV